MFQGLHPALHCWDQMKPGQQTLHYQLLLQPKCMRTQCVANKLWARHYPWLFVSKCMGQILCGQLLQSMDDPHSPLPTKKITRLDRVTLFRPEPKLATAAYNITIVFGSKLLVMMVGLRDCPCHVNNHATHSNHHPRTYTKYCNFSNL